MTRFVHYAFPLLLAAGDWSRRRTSALAVCVVVTVLAATGLMTPVSLAVGDVWFSLFSRGVTGQVVVVEIDPRSIKALGNWPWPRGRHAQLVERLNAAGADVIAFDVDFSSPSFQAEDEKFAQALEAAAGKVVLPAVVQSVADRMITVTAPIDLFRQYALFGYANVEPSRDGLTRDMSLVRYVEGEPVPSLAALVVQNGRLPTEVFGIDFSIRKRDMPRLSYIDVLEGRFDPQTVRGKRVFIGATAVEMGDRLAVPVYGVIPGVHIHALVSESVLQDRMLVHTGLFGQFALVLLATLLLNPSGLQWGFRPIGGAFVLSVAGLLVTSAGLFALVATVVDPVPAVVAGVICVLLAALRELALRSNAVLRERTTSSLRQLMISLIVEDSSDGIVVVRDNGRIELCNEQAARMLSATRKTLTGRPVRNFLPSYDTMTASTGAAADGSRACDLKLDVDDGELVVELSVRRTALGAMAGAGGLDAKHLDFYTMRDVTAVRKARAAEMRAQEERLLAERAKNNFVANMSHELRTPLNAIIGFSEMLASELLGRVEQRAYVEHADIVVKSSHHLLAVVNNVIDVARLDSDIVEVSQSELSLVDTAGSSVELVKALSIYKAHDIRVAIAPEAEQIISDRRLLRQVAYNLVSNAVKYSPEGSRVTVSAWIEGQDAVLEFADQGDGIDEQSLPHLAELFGHAQSAFNRPHDGLGVGLYLVKRCLDKLQGRISFDSKVGRGTVVRVVLPGAAVLPLRVATAVAG
jgi:signal transduction histidine kinase